MGSVLFSFIFCLTGGWGQRVILRLTRLYFQTESTEFDFFYYLKQTISVCFKSTPKMNSRWYFCFFSLELPQRTRKSSLKYQSGSIYLAEITLFIQCTLADLIFLPLMPVGCRMSSTSLSYVFFFFSFDCSEGMRRGKCYSSILLSKWPHKYPWENSQRPQ